MSSKYQYTGTCTVLRFQGLAWEVLEYSTWYSNTGVRQRHINTVNPACPLSSSCQMRWTPYLCMYGVQVLCTVDKIWKSKMQVQLFDTNRTSHSAHRRVTDENPLTMDDMKQPLTITHITPRCICTSLHHTSWSSIFLPPMGCRQP